MKDIQLIIAIVYTLTLNVWLSNWEKFSHNVSDALLIIALNVTSWLVYANCELQSFRVSVICLIIAIAHSTLNMREDATFSIRLIGLISVTTLIVLSVIL